MGQVFEQMLLTLQCGRVVWHGTGLRRVVRSDERLEKNSWPIHKGASQPEYHFTALGWADERRRAAGGPAFLVSTLSNYAPDHGGFHPRPDNRRLYRRVGVGDPRPCRDRLFPAHRFGRGHRGD